MKWRENRCCILSGYVRSCYFVWTSLVGKFVFYAASIFQTNTDGHIRFNIFYWIVIFFYAQVWQNLIARFGTFNISPMFDGGRYLRFEIFDSLMASIFTFSLNVKYDHAYGSVKKFEKSICRFYIYIFSLAEENMNQNARECRGCFDIDSTAPSPLFLGMQTKCKNMSQLH